MNLGLEGLVSPPVEVEVSTEAFYQEIIEISNTRSSLKDERTQIDNIINQLKLVTVLHSTANLSNVSDEFTSEFGEQLTAAFPDIDLTDKENVLLTLDTACEGIIASIMQKLKNFFPKVIKSFKMIFGSEEKAIAKLMVEIDKFNAKKVEADISNLQVLGHKKEGIDTFLTYNYMTESKKIIDGIKKFKPVDIDNTVKINMLSKSMLAASKGLDKSDKTKLSALGFSSMDDLIKTCDLFKSGMSKFKDVEKLASDAQSIMDILVDSHTTTSDTTGGELDSDGKVITKSSSTSKSVDVVYSLYDLLEDVFIDYFVFRQSIALQLLDSYRVINKKY